MNLEEEIERLEKELRRLKNMPVGQFNNPEAMAYHMEFFHKVYWQLERAKEDLRNFKYNVY